MVSTLDFFFSNIFQSFWACYCGLDWHVWIPGCPDPDTYRGICWKRIRIRKNVIWIKVKEFHKFENICHLMILSYWSAVFCFWGCPVSDPEGYRPAGLRDRPPQLRGGPLRQEEGQGLPLHSGKAQGQVNERRFRRSSLLYFAARLSSGSARRKPVQYQYLSLCHLSEAQGQIIVRDSVVDPDPDP